ncbi:MAG: hypothetical protein K2W82_17840 [Candidatus Obscuribacterales bacterium]|nr:hypothetical protein [Candidatus Obscuribacterales bacterium]
MLRFILCLFVCAFLVSADTATAAPRGGGDSRPWKTEETRLADGSREVRTFRGKDLAELKIYGVDGSYRKSQNYDTNIPGKSDLYLEETWDEQAQVRTKTWYEKASGRQSERRTYKQGVVEVLRLAPNGSRHQLTWATVGGSVKPGAYVGEGKLTEVRTWDTDGQPLCILTLAGDGETIAKVEPLQEGRSQDVQAGKSIHYYFADGGLFDLEFSPFPWWVRLIFWTFVACVVVFLCWLIKQTREIR